MKRNLLNIVCLFLLISCSKDVIEIQQGNCIPFYISDTYSYPILPGTNEWNKLGSLAEMVEVCQLPSKKIKSISTEGLLETLLNYPLILDYIFFENMQNGFSRIKSENIGFAELYNRKDIFKVVTERYRYMSLDCGKNLYPPFVAGAPAPNEVAFQTYEFFIFQDEFLDNLNENQQYQVFELVYEKLQNKTEHQFAEDSKLVSIAILGKIMYKNDFLPFVNICNEIDFMKYFIDKIPMYRPENVLPVEIIEENARKYKANR